MTPQNTQPQSRILSKARATSAAVLYAAISAFVAPAAFASPAPNAASAACPALLNVQTQTLRGKPLNLCDFQGKVILVVNTASYCGFTSQYKALEALHRKYASRGLVVLGVPTNDFGAQEPGSDAQVAEFCERTYQVSFPMATKSTFKGPEASPFLSGLAVQSKSPAQWNFHKYLIDRQATSVQGFGSKVAPDASELTAAIEALLAQRPR